MEFRKGDKVRIKSVGPVMNVTSVEKTALGQILFIECSWVSPKMKHYTERFRPEELMLVESAPDEGLTL